MSRALRLTSIYLVVGLTWIYFSDTAIENVTDDPSLILRIQTWKGAAYVVVTGLLVFALSWRALARQSRLIARLEHDAYHHELTGLPNRRLVEARLGKQLARARHDGSGVGLITLDLDHFGDINDSFGHPVGNELLIAVARRLERSLSDCALLAHPSADEFLLVVEGVTDRGELLPFIERIREQLSSPFSVSGVRSVYLTACIGAAHAPEDADDADQLLQYAEAALARAKHLGSNAFELFEAEMVERTRRQVELDARLRRALENGHLQMHYQPIVGGKNLDILGYEALMRWHPVDGPPVPPSEFIPAAENSGLILMLGDWAIEQVCLQIARWQRQGMAGVAVSVNLSARQFASGELANVVRDSLERHGVDPGSLTLEITESLLMDLGAGASIVLDKLRRLGVGLSLDDFGTGYSSLAYLRHLPVDTLKIDRAFIDSLDSARTDRAIVEAVISMARIFGLTVVAEGVETRAQLGVLQDLGCDRFQGYLFGRPGPAQVFPLE
ncbi:MAG: bifunctional diguanylate cyclase/phosphodiesterase [Xanthomonadales bacterium]|nr:bifunctional diguanylate cyclase/phosphodiesterase [Xanthomonadales bacterium]